MEGMLRVDASSTFPGSPSSSFLTDEVASTCPLLTPSPPTNALVNPEPEPEAPKFLTPQELVTKLHQVQDDGSPGRDSASQSSSSSALAEPACSQLLSGHNPYVHITKDEETAAQETAGKTQPMQMTFRNPPENYFFMKWNWPLIRKFSTWFFLAVLVAMLGIVIAMVWRMPKTCNPPTAWYQGPLMYEIFPASFSDSGTDGIGDLRGIASRVAYLAALGVKTVRLNSIFPAHNYPESYKNATNLVEIAPQLGNLTDLIILADSLHGKGMFLALDLPVWPLVKNLSGPREVEGNVTEYHPIEEALVYWSKWGVDGFYLKGLEFLLDDPNLPSSLRKWKKFLGQDKMIMVHHAVVENASHKIIDTILSNVDLVDIRLEMESGSEHLSNQIEAIFNGTLFEKAGNPWVHWSLSNENTVRLANRLPYSNATLGASLLLMMLPGTPSIFYGDEIGLQQVSDPHQDRKSLQHLHQFAPMAFSPPGRPFTRQRILPWMHSQPTPLNFAQVEFISRMAALRASSPSIYVNALTRDGTSKPNAEVKYKQDDLLVIQRWYPRRKSYVVVSNLGYDHISADLSKLLYAGEIVVGPTTQSKPETISFKYISLWPGESVIVSLQ